MTNVFFTSDTHWGHSNILTFTNNDGSLLRPEFTDVDHMNEYMVYKWNSVVKPEDKVYHLGDVAMGKRGLEFIRRCNGTKVLIKGNHDKEKLSLYAELFKDVRGSHQMDGIIMTHIPINPPSLARWGCNVHGHLHSNQVLKLDAKGNETKNIDPRYICVSVEQIAYTPISLEDLKLKIKERQS